MEPPDPERVAAALLAWYDAGHRDMPWRKTRDPYRILVAEILLQRTRVASGQPYYERFIRRFPDVRSLASASEEEVLLVWEGLGFYRRARNLHAAAKAIVRDHGGFVPADFERLASLPGIGPYTAGAVASIAFELRFPAVDGNVTRVLARLFRIEQEVTTGLGRKAVQDLAAALVPGERPGSYNQALMELGATICLPRSPACDRCPLAKPCLARAAGLQETLPVMRRPSKAQAVRVAFGLVESGGKVLLIKRPSGGLLAGLWSLPGGEISRDSSDDQDLIRMVHEQAGVRVDVEGPWRNIAHTFSHRRWSGTIFRCTLRRAQPVSDGVRWASPSELRSLPLVPFHREALESLRAEERWAAFDGNSA
jgi:A/G-specific adenine glycosylase